MPERPCNGNGSAPQRAVAGNATRYLIVTSRTSATGTLFSGSFRSGCGSPWLNDLPGREALCERVGELANGQRLMQQPAHARLTSALFGAWADMTAHQDDGQARPPSQHGACEFAARQTRHGFIGEQRVVDRRDTDRGKPSRRTR